MSTRKTIRIPDILSRVNLHAHAYNGEKLSERLERLSLYAAVDSELAFLDNIRSFLYFVDILTEPQSHALIDTINEFSVAPIARYVATVNQFNQYLDPANYVEKE